MRHERRDRHVDTAQACGDEGAVVEGIAAADVPREGVFLATKVRTGKLGDDGIEGTRASLRRLGVECDVTDDEWSPVARLGSVRLTLRGEEATGR